MVGSQGLASITDVAKEAGVGVGTVSRVLNDSPHVSPDTRARVEAAIARLGYRPSPAARALSAGRSDSICVVLPPLRYPGSAERLAGAVEVLGKREFEIVLSLVETPEEVAGVAVARSSVDRPSGVLFLDLPVPTEAALALLAAEVPAAVSTSFETILPGSKSDGARAVRLATEHLIGLGHREIALVQHPEHFLVGQAPRRRGYLDALSGIGARPRIETVVDREDPDSRARIRQLLAPFSGITAVAATWDDLAYSVLAAADEASRRVPEDLSVVGSGNLEPSAYLGLTTVCESLRASGASAARQLLAMIDGTPSDLGQEELEVALVLRKTTGPPVT